MTVTAVVRDKDEILVVDDRDTMLASLLPGIVDTT